MSEDQHDIEGLLRKNAELLGEVKGLKAKLAEIEAERDTALADAADAKETSRQVSIEKPLQASLGEAFVAPWRVVRPLLDEHFDFGVHDDGTAAISDKQGNAIAADSLFAEICAIPDLAAMLRPARGGGSKGSNIAHSYDGDDSKADKRERVASPFGLR